MSFDFSSLSTDPLIYFLAHSTLFVVLIAAIFFTFGLAFGWLTWARYKSQRRNALSENELLKNEVVLLKRRLVEQIARASSPAEAPAHVEAPPARPAHAGSDAVLDSFLSTAAAVMKQEGSKHLKPDPAPPPAAESEPPAKKVERPKPAPHEEPKQRKTTRPVRIKNKDGKGLSDQQDTGPALKPMPESAHTKTAAPGPDAPPSPAVDSTPDAPVRLMSDPHLGLVYPARPTPSDDLSHLKGVASVIERRLNELGVYTFKQIALWDDENILEFSNLLAFKDRIHREQWVEQARELHFQKYGERL